MIKQSLPESPPLVVAGGLANGAQVAAMLVLGASGAVLGTRFLATPESIYTPNRKNAVLAATHTVRTFVFDQVMGTVAWPAGVDGRVISNKTLEDEAKGMDFRELKKLFAEATQNDDTSRSAIWAGASVGLVNKICGAEVGTCNFEKLVVVAKSLLLLQALTRELHMEIVTHLGRASVILGGK